MTGTMDEASENFCRGCGTRARAEDSFCVSCGRRLNSEASDAEVREEKLSTTDASVKAEPLKLGRTLHEGYKAASKASAGSLSGMLGRLGFWRLLALILVGLIASVILSPLVLLALVLLFGASLIGVIVRLGQRRSFARWGGVAVGSLFLAFVFNGFSNALYGGVLGISEADYRVIDSNMSYSMTAYGDSTSVPALTVSVLSDADDEDEIRSVVESISENDLAENDLGDVPVVEVYVFDPDTTVEDPSEPVFGVGPKDTEADPLDIDPNGSATINLDVDGYETFLGGPLPPSYYEVSHAGNDTGCDTLDASCKEYILQHPIEQYPIPGQ